MSSIKRALISVSDKSGLVDFARFLAEAGVEILSTGGSAKAIADAGIAVTEVSDYTQFPEMMDGRVKTLHPKVHGGILARRDLDHHVNAMTEHNIEAIDMLVVNLYPFEETVAKGADFDSCIENIDIGGPAMVRSAAKNHNFVTIITDVKDYGTVQAAMTEHNNQVPLSLNRKLAAKAYSRTAEYDSAIANWFAQQLDQDAMPEKIHLSATLQQNLRYGENPHQQAAFYALAAQSAHATISSAQQLHGKELSYNNINDTDAALELVKEFDPADGAAVAIIKHANPCGVAQADNLHQAYLNAYHCDTTSAFGGIIATNSPIDLKTAEEISKIFTEVIIAPSFDDDAFALLSAKKNLRLMITGPLSQEPTQPKMVKQVSGGLLYQDTDYGRVTLDDLKVVTERKPSEQELKDLLFAFKVCKHVKSNAIIYVKQGSTVGIGAGQMSRVDSARIAARKADDMKEVTGLDQSPAIGSVVASDAFFPFADGLLQAAEAGVTAVIQPGGSIRDDEVIQAANEQGLAMVFTGMRHFRH